MTNRIRRLMTIAALVGCFATSAAAQGTKEKTKLPQLPPAVTQAIQANKPGAEIDKVEIEKENGVSLYDIEFKDGKGEIEVAEDGTVIDVTDIVTMKDVPEAAAGAIKTAAKGKPIKQLERSEVRAEVVKESGKGRVAKLPAPKYVYEAELAKGEIEVTPDGKVIKGGK
ncbi:MAG TPA: hypothetical protein VKB50_01160 [Vicinamibacterales bacterium]|nr:hypothetical protein [Vicinamibacterales bacterium]